MMHYRIKEQDENVTESDIEALERFLDATANSGETMANKLDLRKYFLTVSLTLLTSSLAILIAWSKRAGKYEHNETTANFLMEGLKCVLSLVALFIIWRSDGITQDNNLSMSFVEVSIYPIPAALYQLIKHLLLYYIFAYVDAPKYQILKNLNIISTGVLYRLILKRRLAPVQWHALILLFIGLTTIQLDPSSGRVLPLQGWVITILIAVLSGFADVYTEAIIKKYPSRNINVHNFWLSIFGLIFNLVAIFDKDFEDIIFKGFFYGYSFITVSMIFIHALSGIAILMVMKYADNIVKVYSTSFGILLSTMFFFETKLIIPFLTGSMVMVTSVLILGLEGLEGPSTSLGRHDTLQTGLPGRHAQNVCEPNIGH